MIVETGRILAIEPNGLWVETIQRSACHSCQAQKGCGQRLLATMGGKASRLWVLLEGRDPARFRLGDEVRISVPEAVLVRGALLVYLMPLLIMIGATLFAHARHWGEGATVSAALLGILVGALIVRVRSWQIRFDPRLQPVLVDAQSASATIQICTLE